MDTQLKINLQQLECAVVCKNYELEEMIVAEYTISS